MHAIGTGIVLLVVALMMLDSILYQLVGYKFFAKYKYVDYFIGSGFWMMYKLEMED